MSAAATGHPLDELRAVGLDELNARAALQHRTDRKYLMSPSQLELLLGRLPARTGVLEIAGRRRFRYESVYFDTPDLYCYRATAHRRPARFKVRTRTYVDTGTCWTEVKLRSRHGQTLKHRHPHDEARPDELTPRALAFVQHFALPSSHAADLRPVLTTAYQRTTLVLDDSRMTIDVGLVCSDRAGTCAALVEAVVLETKTHGPPSGVDRHLWAMHIRPLPISKFGMGLAVVRPHLPHNRWHRTLQRHPWTTP